MEGSISVVEASARSEIVEPLHRGERLVSIREIPDEEELFVIGDVHGCADELEELLERLPLTESSRIVFVGDYIDRGPSSRRVVEQVIELSQRHHVHALMGNHESSLIEFLDEPASSLAARFLLNGGGATLQSYSERPGAFDLPTDHVEFIRNLAAGYRSPSYFFVHAGLPDVPIAELDGAEHSDSMLWIRRDFFNSSFSWDRLIIHGHTPRDEVDFARGRINIDTGCVFDNKLTALRLPQKIVYQVPRRQSLEHLFLRDSRESRRRAVRFDGRVRVSVVKNGASLLFETVNYNDFGVLIQSRESFESPLFVRGDVVSGTIELPKEDDIDFKGRIVRVESHHRPIRYAIEFDSPTPPRE